MRFVDVEDNKIIVFFNHKSFRNQWFKKCVTLIKCYNRCNML